MYIESMTSLAKKVARFGIVVLVVALTSASAHATDEDKMVKAF
jgi:hypothetical protein